MSFGPSNETKVAENNLGGIANAAQNIQFPQLNAAGGNLLNLGQGNVKAGTDFLSTILGGNAANTTAALQPSIDQIRGGNTAALNAISTLMPRGGGRSASLFGQSFAPQSQIQNLFNTARTTAATALPQIGMQQSDLGANLFGLGNQSLGVASGASSSLGDIAQRQQQMNNQLVSGLGGGLFNLLSLPLGGGGTLAGGITSGIGNLFRGGGGSSSGGFTPYSQGKPFTNPPTPYTPPYYLPEPPLPYR